MMTLQLVSKSESLLHEIADQLLTDRLIANAMISSVGTYKVLSNELKISTSKQYSLKGISKSLLFSRINKRLQETYGDRMPLVYSEPIILIDAFQIEQIMEQLTKV